MHPRKTSFSCSTRLYLRALEFIERLSSFGPTVILSDGDVVFQRRRVRRSGRWDIRSLFAPHEK